jgi:hypothetical protein
MDNITVKWAEMLKLARQAVESLKRREGENINEWARKIAEEVSKAND